MRKIYLLTVMTVLSLSVWAWNSPVTIPDVGNARLHIVGQNAENYVSVLDASNSKCATQAEFQAKTNKMANAFLAMQADIVSICEVQRDDEILSFICNAMNTLYGQNVYTYVTDGIDGAVLSDDNYMPLKSGFIYRSDKVTPVGSSSSPYYYEGEYNSRMRIQAFKEISTDEIFTLSMNHFKAKSGADQGERTRRTNANNLVSALSDITYDPDILIMGDLNAYPGEEPILILERAGYEEMLLEYDPGAYTYIYLGTPGILDHVMANSTMATQITGAYAYHINTAGGYYYKYSDHDAVVVGINLGTQQGEGFEQKSPLPEARKVLINGVIYIELNGTRYDLFGRHITDY